LCNTTVGLWEVYRPRAGAVSHPLLTTLRTNYVHSVLARRSSLPVQRLKLQPCIDPVEHAAHKVSRHVNRCSLHHAGMFLVTALWIVVHGSPFDYLVPKTSVSHGYGYVHIWARAPPPRGAIKSHCVGTSRREACRLSTRPSV
jgi:hypothetical protein